MSVNEETFVSDDSEEKQSAEPDGLAGDEDARNDTGRSEKLSVSTDEEIARTSARIAELEEVATTSMNEIASIRQSMEEMEGMWRASKKSLADAVSRYRGMVIQANPGILSELIVGDSIDSVDESLLNAKSLVGKVREGLESEVSLKRVPTGTPERRLPDLSDLSPREKIQYGIGGKR